MLVEPQSLSVRFVGPMKMPAFFAAHGVQDIQTIFVHDVGQRVITIERPGLAIVPNDYFFGDTRRQWSPEMGHAAEARLLELIIAGK